MKAHELAKQLLSMPDVEVRYVVYDTEFDLKWTVPVVGLDLDRVRLNDKQVITFETRGDYSLCKKEQFNPNLDFQLLNIEFYWKGTDKPVEELNEDYNYPSYALYILFSGHEQYCPLNKLKPEEMDVMLTTGFDKETWNPVEIRLSVEEAKAYIEANYEIIRDGKYPDIWYDVEEKINV